MNAPGAGRDRLAHRAWHTCAEWLEHGQAGANDRGTGPGPVADVHGHCSLCDAPRTFLHDAAAPAREDFACSGCGCIGRQRAVAAVLLHTLREPRQARLYATEHASPFHLALRRHVGRLSGSEFVRPLRRRLRLSAWLWRAGVPALVRYADATALPHADAAFDGIVSQDVLEHIPDYRAALREFARVLRPGAPLVATVPFQEGLATNRQIAWITADGRVEHDGAPEYHGDPVSGGVLCFHHFGWSLLGDLRAAGFAEASALRVLDPVMGLPQPQWVLLAIR